MTKKIAILIAGWHFPKTLFTQISNLTVPEGYEFDVFVVTHRDIDLPVVHEEKKELLQTIDPNDYFGRLDHELYSEKLTRAYVESLGFKIIDAENKYGDYYYINQWMEHCDYRDYEYIYYTHDDNYITNRDVISDIVTEKCKLFYNDNRDASFNKDWLMVYNTNAPRTTVPRGSFSFFKQAFFTDIINKFDMSKVTLDRVGETTTPTRMNGVSDWNAITRTFNSIIQERGLQDKVIKLSSHYRHSPYMIEGERGMITKVFA